TENMLVTVIFFLISLNSCYQLSVEQKFLHSEWLQHKLKYNLNYSDSEETDRKDIFSRNYAFIVDSNKINKNFTLKMNKFGHLVSYINQIKGKNERLKLFMPNSGKKLHEDPSPIFVGESIPDDWHWERARALSSVKDQSGCGSCYAFSAIGAIESQFAIHNKLLEDLSAQEIIDCSWEYWNYGCYGGTHSNVFDYCMENGISTSLAYPYRGQHYQCNRNNPNSSYKLTGYNYLTKGDEDNLLRALIYIGPISISINAGSDEFIFYDSGIIDFSSCDSVDSKHAVLAIGYSLHKRPHLIVKNSWGINWGMDGYFSVALFRNNMCGIASS
ncbi:hypothetical protein MXB_968, partial [Myxobolus squamalis]